MVCAENIRYVIDGDVRSRVDVMYYGTHFSYLEAVYNKVQHSSVRAGVAASGGYFGDPAAEIIAERLSYLRGFQRDDKRRLGTADAFNDEVERFQRR